MINIEKESQKGTTITLLGLIITSILTVMSWGIINYLQGERDKDNKIREIKINYLIEAYKKLANASQRPTAIKSLPALNPPPLLLANGFSPTNRLSSNTKDVESAIADIQLFGSKEDIQSVSEDLRSSFDTDNSYTLLELSHTLNRLRNSLRKEINLEAINSGMIFYRPDEIFTFDSSKNIKDKVIPK